MNRTGHICYEPYNPRGRGRQVILWVRDIVEEYQAQGWGLTLRQVYYQLVARDLIPNTYEQYKNVGKIVTKARRGGFIPWGAIEDRTRWLRGPDLYDGLGEISEQMIGQYRRDKWEGIPVAVEVWIEKDALISIAAKASGPLDVQYFSTRGYPSDPALHKAAGRFTRYAQAGHEVKILHLADHDPSGLDMTRDIAERLAMYLYNPLTGEDYSGSVSVDRIALTWDQIQQYDPPPNWAKTSDSRTANYVPVYGEEVWELDALSPQVIMDLIRDNIQSYIVPSIWEDNRQRQEEERDQLRLALEDFI